MNIDQLFGQIPAFSTPLSPIEAVVVPDSWSQGRTVFGGISAGLLYQAIVNQSETPLVLRSLSAHFLRPLQVDTPFAIQVDILRQGKNTAIIEARALQAGAVCASITACFGVARATKVVVKAEDQHGMRPPKRGHMMMKIPGVGPAFLRHVDLDIVTGGLPFLGKKSATYAGYMRFKKAPAVVTDAHIIALIDCWPPTVLQMFKGPAPASTLSWNLEFIHPHRPIAPADWLAYHATTRQSDEGYAHTEANIWDAEGKLVAISRQVVAVFA